VCPDVYQSSGKPEPEDRFDPGELRHLVAGNRGRLLDPRRTPVTVTAVSLHDGTFEVRIEAFEDAGASWRVPLEDVSRYQFASGEPIASDETIARMREAELRLNVPLRIGVDPARAAESLARLDQETASASMWLESRMTERVDLEARVRERAGDPRLMELLERFMRERGLIDIESAFTRAFVSNPSAGELVRGHAIVLAELGLCPYDGKIIRDSDAMSGALDRERRAQHLLGRLAFSRALWRRIGRGAFTYRAYSSEAALRAPAPDSFVSATFSREVALSHFGGGPATRVAAIWRSPLDPGRALMSFLETRAMSERYREAEVVLIGGGL
jgi:hypothetical protein